MKLYLTFLTIALFSFGAVGSVKCDQLKLKISKFYQDHLEFNARHVKYAKKPLHLWNHADERFLNKITRQSEEKLEIAIKYSTIYNALCKH